MARGARRRAVTMRRLRVLHVIDSLWGGGAEVSMLMYLEVAGRQPGTEHRAVILRGDDRTRDAAARLPVETVVGPPAARPHWSDSRRVRSEIADFRPDLVHSVLFRSTLAAGRATAWSGIPMLVTLTSVAYEIDELAGVGSHKARLGLRLSHALHRLVLRRKLVTVRAVSQPVADRAIEIFGLDPMGITVVPDLRPDPARRVAAKPGEIRRRLGLGADDPVLIYIAREHQIKHHLALLEAAAVLLRRRPALRVILAGPPGNATPSIDAAITRQGLGDAVLRLGHRDDVADLLEASDLFVSTSTSEGLGAAVIEALGMGLPVVAVDNPGIREVLGSDHPGLVPGGDTNELASRIDRFLDDAQLRAEVSRAGRSRFLDLFEIEHNTPRIDQVYRQAVQRGSAKRPRPLEHR